MPQTCTAARTGNGCKQACRVIATPRLQIMIEDLSKRAEDSDLLSLLATSRRARLYNAALAQELRDYGCGTHDGIEPASGQT